MIASAQEAGLASAFATAINGDGNSATASGDNSLAGAWSGDDNTATPSTDGCTANATGGGQIDNC